ncbi:hypothetical protein WR25_03752 [Diploscapter pachys]|uniref:Uncharacterized protein n=1 Tax=Diploscapter pachys TaxID=2018661 RepID=A0A2A2LN86_9BILA|nr:hypothetical protein WR25_03752 [Diploscapter pachys]
MMGESHSNSSAVFYLPEAGTGDSDENEKDDEVNDEFELPMAAVITMRRRTGDGRQMNGSLSAARRKQWKSRPWASTASPLREDW